MTRPRATPCAIGARIDELLSELGMTWADLAVELDVTSGAVSLWRTKGQIAEPNRLRICALLGAEYGEIFVGESPKPAKPVGDTPKPSKYVQRESVPGFALHGDEKRLRILEAVDQGLGDLYLPALSRFTPETIALGIVVTLERFAHAKDKEIPI